MLNATEFALLSDIGQRLQTAGHGQRGAVLEQAMRTLNCSQQTVYRKLEEAGFQSGRKRRSDAGESMLSESELTLIAVVLRASTNKKGQRMTVQDAIDILRADGKLSVDVSDSTVSRQLYQRRWHPDQLALPTPSVSLRSLHPNHTWQLDSTTGSYYYMPGGRLRFMASEEFNKNKPHNLVKASSDLLTRYAIADHTSHAFKARHYLGGETTDNLIDFFVWAIWKQPHSPVHGVPFHLMMDPGGANRSHVMRDFCRRLGITPYWHESSQRKDDAARVTGSVEKAHDLIRMHFEPRLRFEDPRQVTLDSLNDGLWRWEASFQSTRVHTRHGRTRYGGWMEIAAEQLRVPANLNALRNAATRKPVSARVENDRTVWFNGAKYDVALVPGAAAGLRITVVENVFRSPAIDVLFTHPETGEETWHVVEPLQSDEWGFRVDGPVIGQEMRTAAHSDVDRARNQFMRQAYGSGKGLPTLEEAARMRKAHAQAMAGQVDAMADVKATPAPTFLPRRNTTLELAEQRQVEAPRLSVEQACDRLIVSMGPRYSPAVYAYVADRYAEGVPESELPAISAAFDVLAPDDVQQQPAGGLRAAGGM